jgi:hypothetical protein
LFFFFSLRSGDVPLTTTTILWGGNGTGVEVGGLVLVGEIDGVGLIEGVGVFDGVSVGLPTSVSVDCMLSAVEANDVEVDSNSMTNTVAWI